jgi:hypothetical protein
MKGAGKRGTKRAKAPVARRKPNEQETFKDIVADARRRVLDFSGVDLPDSEIIHMIRNGGLPGDDRAPVAPPASPPPPPRRLLSKDETIERIRVLAETLWQKGYDAGYEARGQEDGGWED